MIGAKPDEFRGYPAPRALWGQRIVIHAGARPVRPDEIEDLLQRLDAEARGDTRTPTGLAHDVARELLLKVRAAHKCRLLPLSMALGTVVLGRPQHAVDRFKLDVADSDRGNFNWAWPLSDIRHFEPPIPMRGAQGFFNVNILEAA